MLILLKHFMVPFASDVPNNLGVNSSVEETTGFFFFALCYYFICALYAGFFYAGKIG